MSITARSIRTVLLAGTVFALASAVAQAKPYESPAFGVAARPAGIAPTFGTPRMSPDATVRWTTPTVRQFGTYMPSTAAIARASAQPTDATRSTGANWTAISVAAAIVAALLALGVVFAGRARVRHA